MTPVKIISICHLNTEILNYVDRQEVSLWLWRTTFLCPPPVSWGRGGDTPEGVCHCLALLPLSPPPPPPSLATCAPPGLPPATAPPVGLPRCPGAPKTQFPPWGKDGGSSKTIHGPWTARVRGLSAQSHSPAPLFPLPRCLGRPAHASPQVTAPRPQSTQCHCCAPRPTALGPFGTQHCRTALDLQSPAPSSQRPVLPAPKCTVSSTSAQPLPLTRQATAHSPSCSPAEATVSGHQLEAGSPAGT